MKAEAFAEVEDVMSVRVACRETDMEEGRRLESGTGGGKKRNRWGMMMEK